MNITLRLLITLATGLGLAVSGGCSTSPSPATCVSLCSTSASCVLELPLPWPIGLTTYEDCWGGCNQFQMQCEREAMSTGFQKLLDCFATVNCADANSASALEKACAAELKAAPCFSPPFPGPDAAQKDAP